MNEIRPTAKLRRRIKACSVLVAASVIGGIAAANVGGASELPDPAEHYELLTRPAQEGDAPPAFVVEMVKDHGEIDTASLRSVIHTADTYVGIGKTFDGKEICQLAVLGTNVDEFHAGATCDTVDRATQQGLALAVRGSEQGPWASVVIPDGYAEASRRLENSGRISVLSTPNVVVIEMPDSYNDSPEGLLRRDRVIDVVLEADDAERAPLPIRF